eukprot:TRINITY_DN2690_c0_g1_i2.p1 TRINITY_DN2690_c0_g1~~TRINITY_DN2690_c0_g1_i2.p1  ORF type:complete len:113 (+),score=10.89 TRINITY_DN2690_c0_g1_i2:136-474(+)
MIATSTQLKHPLKKTTTTAKNLQYLDYSSLTLKEDLGKGSFGTVKRGYLGNLEVAIKFVEAAEKDFFLELGLMASLPPHPNVLRLHGVCIRPKICMVKKQARREHDERRFFA